MEKKNNKLKIKFTEGEASDLFKDLDKFLKEKNIDNKIYKPKDQK
mgnify:CR=1 FL=1